MYVIDNAGGTIAVLASIDGVFIIIVDPTIDIGIDPAACIAVGTSIPAPTEVVGNNIDAIARSIEDAINRPKNGIGGSKSAVESMIGTSTLASLDIVGVNTDADAVDKMSENVNGKTNGNMEPLTI